MACDGGEAPWCCNEGFETFADLNGDGLLDLVVGARLESSRGLGYWRNAGTSSQPAFEQVVRGESPFVGGGFYVGR